MADDRLRLNEIPGAGFQVKVLKPVDFLHGVVQLQNRIDLVKDRQIGGKKISRTVFPDHALFSSESTYISGKDWDGISIVSVSTYVTISPEYHLKTDGGYFDLRRVMLIAAALRKNGLDYQVQVVGDGSMREPTNKIEFAQGNYKVSVDFGLDSKEVKKEHDKRHDEQSAAMERLKDPDSEEYRDLQEWMKNNGLDRELSEEQKQKDREFAEAWTEAVRNIGQSEEPVNWYKKIKLGLEANSRDEDDVDSILRGVFGMNYGGVEDFAEILDFYARCYQDLIEAICEVEQVGLPQESVLLGSAVIR